jgi:photosystem II stability/assembly factor-like uncharacterized protein
VIDRRRFLKALGLGSMAAALSVWPRAEPRRASSVPRAAANPTMLGQSQDAAPTVVAPSRATVFRGEGGVIFVSDDDGATWTRHSHLGSAYRVKRVRTSRSGQVRLDIGYAGRSFKLRLTPDGRAWRTA